MRIDVSEVGKKMISSYIYQQNNKRLQFRGERIWASVSVFPQKWIYFLLIPNLGVQFYSKILVM